MKIEKKYLEVLIKVLREVKANLADSRSRDKTMKSLATGLDAYLAERKVILDNFADKDEEDNLVLVGENKDQYSFAKLSTEKAVELNKELMTLLDETVDVTVDNVDKLKELINLTEYQPVYGEVEQIDTLLEKMI